MSISEIRLHQLRLLTRRSFLLSQVTDESNNAYLAGCYVILSLFLIVILRKLATEGSRTGLSEQDSSLRSIRLKEQDMIETISLPDKG